MKSFPLPRTDEVFPAICEKQECLYLLVLEILILRTAVISPKPGDIFTISGDLLKTVQAEIALMQTGWHQESVDITIAFSAIVTKAFHKALLGTVQLSRRPFTRHY